MKVGDKLTLRPRAKGIFQIKDTNYNNYLIIINQRKEVFYDISKPPRQ